LLDENGSRQGVLAQLLSNNTVDRYMPIQGLDQLTERRHGRQVKASQTQQTSRESGTEQVDSMQTQLFQRFAELLPNGLAILDSEAEAIFVNDGFFKLTTNKVQNEFRAWPESIHPDDYERVMSAYREAFSSREELRCEFRCAISATGEGGEWRLFLLRPLSDEPDAGFISAIVDITEIKQAQLTQERAAAEARERKEQQERFIDMVSHEIRNPLSAVMHLAEEVREVTKEIGDNHLDLKDQVADILDAADTILLCVSHQNTLVDDILSFSKLDSMMLSLVPREVRPKWEFSQALKVFQSEFKAKNIKFHYAMDVSFDEEDVEHVVADLNRMKQGKNRMFDHVALADVSSSCEPDNERCQVHIQKKWRAQNHSVHGCFRRASYFLSTQRYLLQSGPGIVSYRFNCEFRMGKRRSSIPHGCCQRQWHWY
jgi:PAS domain-containing protein/NTP pyrophosphatase (non-canonical NTP hydrolase)